MTDRTEPDDFIREECPHCDEAPPRNQVDEHVTTAHNSLPPCTATIASEHDGLLRCAFRAGHTGGEYGEWHASRADLPAGRHVWRDTARGATPHRAVLDEPSGLAATQATEPERCCVCGGGPVSYHNYREQPFCWPCADCACNQDLCVRTGINDPAVSKSAARAGQLAAALAEVLLVFSPVSSHNGVRIGWTAPHPIHPDDYDRWNAALNDKEPTP